MALSIPILTTFQTDGAHSIEQIILEYTHLVEVDSCEKWLKNQI